MHIYRHQFVATCPVNGMPIIYNLEISARFVIRAEHIVTACQLFQKGLHEGIAGDLFKRFGGKQVLKAHHHGVEIETRLGTPGHKPPQVKMTERVAA